MSKFVGEVSHERWLNAQNHELETWSRESKNGEDWNTWWADQFENYSFLKGFNVESIFEVGCGPYARNLDLVIKSLGYKPKLILLEDPLLNEYIKLNMSVVRYQNNPNVIFISEQLEKVNLAERNIKPVDIVLCNNVLDHVESVSGCFNQMYNSLKQGGILIFGQDLSGEEDLIKRDPRAFDDGCHPIVVNEEYLKPYLISYQPIFQKVLTRNNTRNPDANSGTLLFAGIKK